jgi:LuxR family maltose regulon positive regulatory protein
LAIAWVSLDPHDNDPARFWMYVVTSLHEAMPHVGKNALACLQASQPPPMTDVLTTVINDLVAVDDDVVLVLDDYHVIQSQPIHEALIFLLDHLPTQLHLVIATREDPPLPLARLRARGQLTEIRAADLRFTPDEAATFLDTVMDVHLSADDVAALEARTEGWIAGLQLAALSLQGRTDVSGFIQGFAGDDRYIVDYLIDEVLLQQPDTTRRFLLETAILDRLSGPLCDAVTRRNDGDVVLRTLERSNLFVVPLDDARRWYRYHHLFAAVLHARLQAEHPDQVATLHQRASAWYEAAGVLPDAIRHALAGGDAARAADLVELATPMMRQARQEATLLGWYRSLPDDVMRYRPVLSAGYASALLSTGELAGVEDRLQAAEQWLVRASVTATSPDQITSTMIVRDHEEFRRLPGVIAIFRAGQALALGDLTTGRVHAQDALERLDADDLVWRGAAASILGLAAWTSGDLAAAYASYAEGMQLLQQAGNIPDAVAGAITRADIRMAQGRLRDAKRIYERGLQLATEGQASVLRGAADMHVGLSSIHREHGDLDLAMQHLQISQTLGEHLGFPQYPYRWCVATARIQEARGDMDGALDRYREAERRYTGDFSPNVCPIAVRMARVHIIQGRLDEAQAWARDAGVSVNDDLSYLHEFAHLTLVRLLLAQAAQDGDAHSLAEAIGLLERLLHAAEMGERWGSVIDILVVYALAWEQGGDLPAAWASLERALTLAEPEGYLRTFVDEGVSMRRLLPHATENARTRSYARRLLQAFEEPAPSPTLEKPATSSLVEPLTTREIEILRLIAAGLRNQEIADQLFISLPTVKRHVANAYGKLEATHRTEAVARAQALNLL